MWAPAHELALTVIFIRFDSVLWEFRNRQWLLRFYINYLFINNNTNKRIEVLRTFSSDSMKPTPTEWPCLTTKTYLIYPKLDNFMHLYWEFNQQHKHKKMTRAFVPQWTSNNTYPSLWKKERSFRHSTDRDRAITRAVKIANKKTTIEK